MQSEKYFSLKQIYTLMKDRKVTCPVRNYFCNFYEKFMLFLCPYNNAHFSPIALLSKYRQKFFINQNFTCL